jgi:hypothetical protein
MRTMSVRVQSQKNKFFGHESQWALILTLTSCGSEVMSHYSRLMSQSPADKNISLKAEEYPLLELLVGNN